MIVVLMFEDLKEEGEEVLEDAPVRDHPGEQCHEHEHRGHAHHPAALS